MTDAGRQSIDVILRRTTYIHTSERHLYTCCA